MSSLRSSFLSKNFYRLSIKRKCGDNFPASSQNAIFWIHLIRYLVLWRAANNKYPYVFYIKMVKIRQFDKAYVRLNFRLFFEDSDREKSNNVFSRYREPWDQNWNVKNLMIAKIKWIWLLLKKENSIPRLIFS